MQALSAQLHKGMKVFDSTDTQIGTVDDYKFTDEDPSTPGPETRDVNPIEWERDGDLAHILARAFSPDDNLSDEVKEKLLREGYVRIDADGLFAADRYITPDQIASVEGDRLILNVPKDALMKRH